MNEREIMRRALCRVYNEYLAEDHEHPMSFREFVIDTNQRAGKILKNH